MCSIPNPNPYSSSDRARNYSHGSEDSASIISEAEKRGTFTKKIPLSEFATLQVMCFKLGRGGGGV